LTYYHNDTILLTITFKVSLKSIQLIECQQEEKIDKLTELGTVDYSKHKQLYWRIVANDFVFW